MTAVLLALAASLTWGFADFGAGVGARRLPIVVVALTSINEGEYLKFPPDGFSLKWYGRFFSDATFMGSLRLSLEIGVVSALTSTLIGAKSTPFLLARSAMISRACGVPRTKNIPGCVEPAPTGIGRVAV